MQSLPDWLIWKANKTELESQWELSYIRGRSVTWYNTLENSLAPSQVEDKHNPMTRKTVQLIIQIQTFLRNKGVILITEGQQA